LVAKIAGSAAVYLGTAIAISVCAEFGCKDVPLCTAAVDKSHRLTYKRYALFF